MGIEIRNPERILKITPSRACIAHFSLCHGIHMNLLSLQLASLWKLFRPTDHRKPKQRGVTRVCMIVVKNKDRNLGSITRINKRGWSLAYSIICLCVISADFGEFHHSTMSRYRGILMVRCSWVKLANRVKSRSCFSRYCRKCTKLDALLNARGI